MAGLPERRLRVGVDILHVERMERLLTEDPRIMDTLFTPREQAYCHAKRRRFDHLAARFCAKEAVLKAFGTGLGQRMRWTDVEIVNQRGGRPEVRLEGEVAAFAASRGLADLDVSMSHSGGFAMAHAVTAWQRV